MAIVDKPRWVEPLITFNYLRANVGDCETKESVHNLDHRIDRLYENGCLTLTHYLVLDKMMSDRMLYLDEMECLDGQG